nr:amidase family protein [Micromonospora sp. DSM 115978]
PAAFCGLPGLKVTWRIVPGGPGPVIEPLTVVTTTLTRSVRDLAHVLDATVGFDARDPYSSPRPATFAAQLGAVPTAGLTVAWLPGFGGGQPGQGVSTAVEDTLGTLVAAAGLRRVDVTAPRLPSGSEAFAAIASLRVYRWLAPHWPECAEALT